MATKKGRRRRCRSNVASAILVLGARIGFVLREAPEPYDSGRTSKPAAAVFTVLTGPVHAFISAAL